jgi:biopolymer transport protein ExbD
MKHAVNVELPRASNVVSETKPQTVRISVDAQGHYFWNETAIDDAELPRRLKLEAAREPQADLHIRGDREVRYERVAQAMAAAQQAGMRKIGFITEPRPAP